MAELPSNQTEPAPPIDQRPSRIPGLLESELMDVETIILIRKKDAPFDEPLNWRRAVGSVAEFFESSLRGLEVVEAKGFDVDPILSWFKVRNLTRELKTAQEAKLNLEDLDVKKELIQSWIYYLYGLINPEEALTLKPYVFKTLLEFLEKAQSELVERALFEMSM